ncbi:hypothetical protein Y032_0002g911 [Ancylostoma ceylanicum]|uniref:Tc1-like transposase DDE domain-containing protein n=1 Tax=Ancylostoma ceylanicum TaxID=53326 RepID=A0A016W1C7_9BILA|nr:hypothetical protein Y032_0002g911 [Ancylostoma ceylanicum]
MAAKISRKDPNYSTIRVLHDNARPLTMRAIRQKLLNFGWKVLTPAPYRPDLASKDYQLLFTLSFAF